MDDFIAKTLRGETPARKTRQHGGVTIEWLDEGILQLTPAGEVRGALVVSAGIHGNETAPVEMLEQLLAPLVRGERPLVWRLLVVLGSPAALRAGRRFVDYDLNRLFGGRWQTATPGVETARAERLEQALETFLRWAMKRCAGIWICIPPFARRAFRALAYCPRARRRGRRIFSPGLARRATGAGISSRTGRHLHALFLRALRSTQLYAGTREGAAVRPERSQPVRPNAAGAVGAAGRLARACRYGCAAPL